MAIKFEPRFTRQAIPKIKKGCLVVPDSAQPCPTLPDKVSKFVSNSPPPTNVPHSFRFHYIDHPFEKDVFENNFKLSDGIYEFSFKEALLGVYDLQSFQNNEFCWSFATTDQTVVLAALKVGEKFDVKLKKPFKKILKILKINFHLGHPYCRFGQSPIHVSIEQTHTDWFRIISAYEPGQKKGNSSNRFVSAFRIFGFRRKSRLPVWRKFLSDATLYAQTKDWGTALIHVAFALESFIDTRLLHKLKRSDLGDKYQDHLLRIGEKRAEFHSLMHKERSEKDINRLSDKINKTVFSLRNKIAHGYQTRESISSDQYVSAIKTTVEFMWDLDKNSRPHLLPIMYFKEPDDLIDQNFTKNCSTI